jgi:hypothetical protein
MKILSNIIKGIFGSSESVETSLQKSFDSNTLNIEVLEKAASIVVKSYSDALNKIDSMLEFLEGDSDELLKSIVDDLNNKKISLDKSYKQESAEITGQLDILKKSNVDLQLKMDEEAELKKSNEVDISTASDISKEDFDKHCVTIFKAKEDGLIDDESWPNVVKSIQDQSLKFKEYRVVAT